jgi:hypothetical protein
MSLGVAASLGERRSLESFLRFPRSFQNSVPPGSFSASERSKNSWGLPTSGEPAVHKSRIAEGVYTSGQIDVPDWAADIEADYAGWRQEQALEANPRR